MGSVSGCIALALLGNNRLLVADEPTTALDVISQQQVLQILVQGSTMRAPPALLFITHDIAVATQLCQRGIVMEKGRIVESGTMDQLLNEPEHPYTRKLVRAARAAEQTLLTHTREVLAGWYSPADGIRLLHSGRQDFPLPESPRTPLAEDPASECHS